MSQVWGGFKFPFSLFPFFFSLFPFPFSLFSHLPRVLPKNMSVLTFLALLPGALACLGYTGGVPNPTASYSNSAVIEIAAGEIFDAGWAKYDRGSGACNEQAEGGKK